MVIYIIVSTIFVGALSIIANIVLAIVSAGLISNYLYLLHKVINYNKITLQDFKDGFTYFLRKVYMIFFFAWIGSLLLNAVSNFLGSNFYILYIIVYLSIFIILNALPETLYLKTLEPMESIIYSFDFIKENWINWLIPNVILYITLFLLTGITITNIFTTYLYFSFDFNPISIIIYLLGQVLFSFVMIYRGHLFKILSGSTRRKRMFMSKF